MSDETIDTIDPEVIAEILRNTNKKTVGTIADRVARKALTELVKSGYSSFLFLKDDETHKYWGKVHTLATTRVEERREALRMYEIKLAAWDRLTPEDRTALKIRKPAKPRG